MPETKVCAQCGTEFEPARPWAEYCSPRCRNRAFRDRAKEERPTFEFEQALQAAIRELRAGEKRKAAATVRRALDKFAPARTAKRRRGGKTGGGA